MTDIDRYGLTVTAVTTKVNDFSVTVVTVVNDFSTTFQYFFQYFNDFSMTEVNDFSMTNDHNQCQANDHRSQLQLQLAKF
jgi:hypothetical protein